MYFHEKLKELRTKKGISQEDLAKTIGVTQGAIAFWESGQRVPVFDAIQELCKALGVKCTVFDGCSYLPRQAQTKKKEQ